MNLSRHIQNYVLNKPRIKDPQGLKAAVIQSGNEWYSRNPEAANVLADNLRIFGLDNSNAAVKALMLNILLHYYEKLLPLFCTPTAYADYLCERVDGAPALATIRNAQYSSEACVVAIEHFGAVELLAPYLTRHGIPVTVVLRFTTPQLSEAAAQQAEGLAKSGLFARIKFIEIGKPGVMAALEMAAAIRRREVLITVCDERTEYSIPVDLLGKRVWGGAGINRIMKLANAPYRLFSAAVARIGDERYRIDTLPIPADPDSAVQLLFDHLAKQIRRYPEQWYFLHENLELAD